MRNPNLAPLPNNINPRHIDVLRNLNLPSSGLGEIFGKYVLPLAQRQGILNNQVLEVASVGASTAAVSEVAFLADQFGGRTPRLSVTAVEYDTGASGFHFLRGDIAELKKNAAPFPLTLDFRDGTDIHSLPGSFDVVMSRNPNPSAGDTFIEGIINAARPGGIIIITSASPYDAPEVTKNLNIVQSRGVAFTRVVEDVPFIHPDPSGNVPNLDDRFWILTKDIPVYDQPTTEMQPIKSRR